jgi:hypothetical protein
MMAAMSCVEGPFGPGFRPQWEEENRLILDSLLPFDL